MMNIGAMNNRIIIKKSTSIQDENDNYKTEWNDFCSTWAYVNGLSGSEYYSAASVKAENTVVFTIRYSKKNSEINPQNFKIIFNGIDYNIKHVDNVQFGNKIVKIKAVAEL